MTPFIYPAPKTPSTRSTSSSTPTTTTPPPPSTTDARSLLAHYRRIGMDEEQAQDLVASYHSHASRSPRPAVVTEGATSSEDARPVLDDHKSSPGESVCKPERRPFLLKAKRPVTFLPKMSAFENRVGRSKEEERDEERHWTTEDRKAIYELTNLAEPAPTFRRTNTIYVHEGWGHRRAIGETVDTKEVEKVENCQTGRAM